MNVLVKQKIFLIRNIRDVSQIHLYAFTVFFKYFFTIFSDFLYIFLKYFAHFFPF